MRGQLTRNELFYKNVKAEFMATVHTLLKKVLFVVQLIYFVLGTQAVFFDR